eukprot:g23362.t1
MLMLLHDDMSATVLNYCGLESEHFIMETGVWGGGSVVKQGCIITATLFTIFIAAILYFTGQNLLKGVQIIYRMDSRLFNLNRFKAKGTASTTSTLELQHADDNAIAAPSAEDLQCILEIVE